MVTDRQVRRMLKLSQSEQTLGRAAAKAGMDEKTARKYRQLGRLPSELKKSRTWRTRDDAFADVWDEVREQLEVNPGLQAKTLFQWLQENGVCGLPQDCLPDNRDRLYAELPGIAEKLMGPRDTEDRDRAA